MQCTAAPTDGTLAGVKVAVALVCAACGVDTFEIDADRSHQPPAQLVVGSSTVTGELLSTATTPGFDTTLVAPGQQLTLHVPTATNGTYATTIDALAVTITTAVTLTQVCMAPDQDDYGTGRCGFSFVGTIAITGDATGTWTLDQLAVVRPGTTDY